MNEEIRDIMQPVCVHHAVVVQYAGSDVRVYGRVCGFEGMPCDGIHPIIEVRTPHGSTLRAGRIWVRPADEIELATLKGYEFAARERGKRLYETDVNTSESA